MGCGAPGRQDCRRMARAEGGGGRAEAACSEGKEKAAHEGDFKMKAVVYTRFSSDRQREASSEDQARNCRRRAESEGWRIGEHYRDEGISGSTADRPGYKAMLRAAQAREFDVLLVDD